MEALSEIVALKYLASVGPLPDYIGLCESTFDVDVPYVSFVWVGHNRDRNEWAWTKWCEVFTRAYMVMHDTDYQGCHDELLAYARWCIKKRESNVQSTEEDVRDVHL